MEFQIDALGIDVINAVVTAPLDRREPPRFPYRVVRKLAPIRRGIQGRFRDVNCSDISAGGRSFYLDYPPDFDEFAITLNSAEHEIVVIGSVIDHQEMKGTAFFLVHSEFVRFVEQNH